jgi:hypothetical protein
VEYQLRAKTLRLRQKGAGVMHDKELLLKLLADSVSTFCVLTRHAMRLCGHEAPFAKREIIERASERFGVDQGTFLPLLDLREGKIKPKSLAPGELFESYLREIDVVVGFVDQLEK